MHLGWFLWAGREKNEATILKTPVTPKTGNILISPFHNPQPSQCPSLFQRHLSPIHRPTMESLVSRAHAGGVGSVYDIHRGTKHIRKHLENNRGSHCGQLFVGGHTDIWTSIFQALSPHMSSNAFHSTSTALKEVHLATLPW